MTHPDMIRAQLDQAIDIAPQNSTFAPARPSRMRKVTHKDIIKALIFMEGGSLKKKLYVANLHITSSALNTGTNSVPVWSPLGKRTTDSSEEFDWSEETTQDILGHTYTTMKKPTITQSFDPWELDGGDAAQQKVHQLAVIEQNAQALTNMDMMIAHFYTTDSGASAGSFAERYDACMVKPSGLGGEGGGNIGMPVDVTYGGNRTVGTVTKNANGEVTFSAGTASAAYQEED